MSYSCIEGQRITGVGEPVLSFYRVDPKDGTQVVSLSSSTFTPSHHAGPAAGFSWPGLRWRVKLPTVLHHFQLYFCVG